MLPKTVILDTNCQKLLGFFGSFLRPRQLGAQPPNLLVSVLGPPAQLYPLKKTQIAKIARFFWLFP